MSYEAMMAKQRAAIVAAEKKPKPKPKAATPTPTPKPAKIDTRSSAIKKASDEMMNDSLKNPSKLVKKANVAKVDPNAA